MSNYNISTHINACTPDTTHSYSGRDGVYIYTKDLLELEHTLQKEQPSIVDPRLAGVHTSLHLAAWSKKLRQHPDKDFSNYILRGIENGFYIGIDPAVSLKPATRNMQSASQHPDIIDDYLQNELLQEQIRGPFSPHYAPSVHINHFGVISKNTNLENGDLSQTCHFQREQLSMMRLTQHCAH